jgi:hypothetical protein
MLTLQNPSAIDVLGELGGGGIFAAPLHVVLNINKRKLINLIHFTILRNLLSNHMGP